MQPVHFNSVLLSYLSWIQSVQHVVQFWSCFLSILSDPNKTQKLIFGVRERMASLAQQFTGLRCAPLSSTRFSKSKPFSHPNQTHKPTLLLPIVSAVAISNAKTKDRTELKKLFEDAYERCRTTPLEGVSFTLDDFNDALEKYDFNAEIGTKVGCPLSSLKLWVGIGFWMRVFFMGMS